MSKRSAVVFVSFGALGIILGVAAFCAFSFFYPILSASVWAIISVVFAVGTVHLNFLILTDRLGDWHSSETLGSIQLLGIFSFIISFGSMFWYIFCSYYYFADVPQLDNHALMTAVWAFMTAKWSLALYFTARKFDNDLSQRYQPVATC